MRTDNPTPCDRSAAAASPHASSETDRERRIVILDRVAPLSIEWTAERIAKGGVVGIPTDTVYGIAASLARPDAIERIFEIKGRPSSQPLPVLVSSIDALSHLVTMEDAVIPLLDIFWPGPLTVVLPAARHLSEHVVGPGNTIGVRLPNHLTSIEVIEKAGGAIACTSANRSGQPPARSAREVADSLGSDLDLILDGGIAPGGVASTVVAIDGPTLRFIREGAIPVTEVIRIWDEVAGEI